ncbi:MAG: hypothetical protein GY719_36680 [bacterium]|nr:hypothetical protein [bacterium]
MSDLAVVWLKEQKGPCVFCGDETTVGAVGWHLEDPVGVACDDCMVDRQRILGDLLLRARAVDNGPVN